MKRRVFIIGVDGATFDVITPMVKAGELPAFARLMDQGAFGELLSTPNLISPSAWTSFLTGVNPGKHGIFEFYEKKRDCYGVRFINASDRKAASLWSILSGKGARVGVVNVPMTYPAEKVNGFLMAGLESPGPEAKGFTYPAGLYEELKGALGRYIMEPGITSHVMAGDLARAEELLYESIENRKASTLYLMKKYPWDFFNVVFRDTDPAQHCFWKFYDKGSPDYEDSPYGRVIPEVYRRIDTAMAEIMAALPEDVTVIVLSDHGFGFRQYANLCLNGWLEESGYLSFMEGDKRALTGRLYRQVEKRFKRKTKERLLRLFPGLRDRVQSGVFFSSIDWAKTRAFADGIREGIYINLKGREPEGVVEPGEYEALREEIIRGLMETRDPQSGEPVVERVLKREDVYEGDMTEMSPDLIVRWRPDAAIGGLTAGNGQEVAPCFLTEEHRTISGDHRESGVLFLSGPEVRGGEIKGASIMDLAPTILHLMGYSVPSDMDGSVLLKALKGQKNVVKSAPSASDGKSAPAGYEPEEEEAVRKRLRDLGYVE
ncbi:MAG: alkaline phosphatase family protein [Thermodesulfobacteriota bacterium]